MREIKFRAWHKNMNSMCQNVTTDLLNRDYLEFMQYTGLKDDNGIEIYEGDIIEIVDSIRTHKCVVKFINGCFVSVEIDDSDEVCLREDIDNFPHAVIGNIYENPELLS